MKKVIANDELREKMKEAIKLLSGTVKTTLGPKGSNIIIDHSTFLPFITNDGVTIAENIESEDEVINTILQIAKTTSIQTNEKVGDGTTTTLVLLESIFNNGIKLIEDGMNPIILKKKLDEYIPYLIDYIDKKSFKPKLNHLYNIASISANDEKIGKIIIEAYKKTKNILGIKIKEGSNNITDIVYKKGYIIESLIASLYFFKDKSNIVIDNPNILIVNNYLNTLEDIATILNYIIKNNKKLIIMADDYSELFINEIVNLYLNENIEIYLLKIPEYGKNKIDLISDLALISNSKVIEDLSYVNETVLGRLNDVIINKEEVIFSFKENKYIERKVNELIMLKSDDYVNKRISMFTNGLVDIMVGANTDIERREKKMRFDDAICALKSSISGVVVGSGLVLYEISENLESKNEVTEIFKESLKEPFNQIMYNAGLNKNEIIDKIKDSNYNKVYNISEEKFEDVNYTKVLDPTLVVINSLVNAISISGMLLTTTSLIINEHQNNLNKVSEYTEI